MWLKKLKTSETAAGDTVTDDDTVNQAAHESNVSTDIIISDCQPHSQNEQQKDSEIDEIESEDNPWPYIAPLFKFQHSSGKTDFLFATTV